MHCACAVAAGRRAAQRRLAVLAQQTRLHSCLPPQVKASQCFTKYHWRPEAEAAAAAGGGVQVVATQVGAAAWLPPCFTLPGCCCRIAAEVAFLLPALMLDAPPAAIDAAALTWRPSRPAPLSPAFLPCAPLPQVVSDYLTAFDDPALMMQAGGKPVVVYTYRWRRRARGLQGAGSAGRGERLPAAVLSRVSTCLPSGSLPLHLHIRAAAPLPRCPCVATLAGFPGPTAAWRFGAQQRRQQTAQRGRRMQWRSVRRRRWRACRSSCNGGHWGCSAAALHEH